MKKGDLIELKNSSGYVHSRGIILEEIPEIESTRIAVAVYMYYLPRRLRKPEIWDIPLDKLRRLYRVLSSS